MTRTCSFTPLQEITGIKCIWIPFAVRSDYYNKNYNKFKDRTISVFTSGILKNVSKEYLGKFDFDTIKLAKIFWKFIFQIPLKKRKKFHNDNIILSLDYSGYSFLTKILYMLKSKSLNPSKIDTNNYFEYLNNSKITYITLSSLELVTPKIFESMISGSLTFSNKSEIYDNPKINITNSIVQYIDENDFANKINYYLKNPCESQKIIDNAVKCAYENHTWDKRIKFLFREINLI